MFSRRKFLGWGLVSAVGLATVSAEVIPMLKPTDGELRLKVMGPNSFTTKIPYNGKIQQIYPNDPEILIQSSGVTVGPGSTLIQGHSLTITSPLAELDMVIKVKRL